MSSLEIAATSLAITLFGPMQVRVQGNVLPPLRSRKALWALALLTLRHDRPVEREWLAGTLWPDLDQSQAFANLRPILSELRRALGDQGKRLQSPDRRTLLLQLTDADVDVLSFDAAIKRGKPADLERVVALYQGPLIEGCNEEWVSQERAVREQHCLHALLQLGEAAMGGGAYSTAVGYYQRAASLDPWSDTARRGWMEALARGGDRNAALQVYRNFLTVLRDDPSAVPDEQTSALYRRLRSEAVPRTSVHAVVTAAAAPVPIITGYLPHPLTELVGREDERLEVSGLLRRSRLVTLTGLGGIGKTRLAIEIATEVAREYADGVWLVALEALSDGKRVSQQIASVFGLREEPGRSLMQSLIDFLRAKRLLLVLDNCEHLLEASAQVVANLLQGCVGIRILATSREALGITGETVWVVPSLATPDPEHLPQGSATLFRVLMGYESVQLFVERAKAAQKDFTLTNSNAKAVAAVCSHLEGIPLAIELAAARIKAMTIDQIASRLNSELGLLASRSGAALSRQQTLTAALDWSYALLTEPTRILLRRLSVFVGGWSLEAAEFVCSTDEGVQGFRGSDVQEQAERHRSRSLNTQIPEQLDTDEVLDLLTSLIDKSFVVFAERETGGRYRMLEIVRQYAAESLEASGEAELIRKRHRDWFVVLAEEVEPHLTGVEQAQRLRQLDVEHDNMRAAAASCKAGADGVQAGLRLTGALWRFWYVRGYWSEGREHLKPVLEREAAMPRTTLRAKALNGAGALAYSQGDYVAARTLHEESLSIRQELADKSGIASSLNSLGNVAYDLGDYASARALHEESLSLRRELADLEGIAWSLNSLGNVAHPQGEYSTARSFYQESLSLFEKLGDRVGVARSLSCLGYVAFDQGDYVTAQNLHEQSLSLFKELGDRGGIAWAYCCLGYLANCLGDHANARALLEEGHGLFKELGDRRGIAWALNSLGNVASDQGDYPRAQELHETSLNIRRELGDKQGTAWSLICLGNVLFRRGGSAATQALVEESLSLFGELRDRKGVAECLVALAIVLASTDAHKAALLWGAADALRDSIGAALPPGQQEHLKSQSITIRVALGQEAFETIRNEGRALTWEQALAGLTRPAHGQSPSANVMISS
jgi:predicted ATPase/DNA-binding SARP family transcriptional activator